MRDSQRAVFGERLSLSVSGLLCPDNCRAEIVPTRPSPQDRGAGAGSKAPSAAVSLRPVSETVRATSVRLVPFGEFDRDALGSINKDQLA